MKKENSDEAVKIHGGADSEGAEVSRSAAGGGGGEEAWRGASDAVPVEVAVRGHDALVAQAPA